MLHMKIPFSTDLFLLLSVFSSSDLLPSPQLPFHRIGPKRCALLVGQHLISLRQSGTSELG